MPFVVEERDYRCREGEVYNGFQCERTEYLTDFKIKSCIFRHIGTGTELWHLDNEDDHNVFSINLRTPPFDSSGVAHVLEHLSLCGSQQYPIHDPFFKMLNRSVATNINALTGGDYTIFPFSSRNEIDFRNIQSIYLDAVFRPKLDYLDFLQEGWRLEHNDLYNRNSNLAIKGVVYNEMKGTFSENFQMFRRRMVHNLMPDNIYNYDAGGNPLEIPKLKYADVVAFHCKYYHPSNARIFCYGSFDIMKTLSFIDMEYMANSDYIDNSHSRIKSQERWSQPRKAHFSCRLENMGAPAERQNQIGIGLLMCPRVDVQEVFELNILSKLLTEGPNSAFYKNLIEPNFSGGFNKNTGYCMLCKDTYLTVGLQDLRVEDFNKFIELFDHTVDKAVKEGFEPQYIESILHNIELSYRNPRPNFGSTLLFYSIALWNHEGDIVSNLQISEMIAKLKFKLQINKDYFQQKIVKYFKDNSHKLTLTMSPDEFYDDKLKLAETKLLQQKIKDLDENKLEKIYQDSIKLTESQKSMKDIDVLPCLSLDDVREPCNWPQVNEVVIQNVLTQICEAYTNETTCLKLIFNISKLSKSEVLLAPLFCYVINAMGTKNHGFREFDQLVQSKTGGFSFQTKLVENVNDAKSYYVGLMMTTHCLDRNLVDMFALCEELLLNFQLDDTIRLKTIIENYVSSITVGIASSGHLYAMQGSAALVTNAAKLKSLLSGVDHIDFIKKYVQENSTEEIRDRLKSFGLKVFSKSSVRGAINCSSAYLSTTLEHYNRFLKNLPSREAGCSKKPLYLLEPGTRHHVLTIPVNFCAKTFFAVPYMHTDHPMLRILAKFVSAKYLLPLVREQNGAYAAGAKIGFDGLFHFYSYRDPHSTNTLTIFDKTSEWLQAESDKLDEQKLLEAKLGVLQLVDWPLSTGDIGIDNFVLRCSHEMYLAYRSRVLSVTIEDLKNIIDKYFKVQPKYFGKFILGPKV
ncbi:hypothetical protein KR222_008721 [Zaprionus bogoriensis]|nr:hypothetical protein KR222_008721 [Zaprionus bogoriensis]